MSFFHFANVKRIPAAVDSARPHVEAPRLEAFVDVVVVGSALADEHETAAFAPRLKNYFTPSMVRIGRHLAFSADFLLFFSISAWKMNDEENEIV